MENNNKTADKIVRLMAKRGEPVADIDGSWSCFGCPGAHGTDYRYVKTETGRESIMEHAAECTWRMALDYVKAVGQ